MQISDICFTLWKGPLKSFYTPSEAPFYSFPRAPNNILKLLKLVHLSQCLDLRVFPDLCRFVLVELKLIGPGDECRALFTMSARFHRTCRSFFVST